MRAAAGALSVLALLAACAPAPAPDGPFAPGIDRRGEEVDPLVVGNRLLEAKQYELAQDAFTRAAARDGMTADVYAGLGAASFGLGQVGQAERQLRKAIDFPEAAPETWNNLGLLLLETDRVPEAVEVLRRAFALSDGESDEIKANLRKALATSEKNVYTPEAEQQLDLVPAGHGVYELRDDEQFP
ncbi:hypothetical protein ACRARG_15450 [Pseudooceanicola sp. C21-150M6]|uniref:hypothetical protein n=1 Tax=Pseudooceanicola sp. C21-150M6 TaxID=3434355 RepID=UPI003D7FD524